MDTSLSEPTLKNKEIVVVEITVGVCESFKAIGIDISEADLRKFEQALYERGLNVAPRINHNPKPINASDVDPTAGLDPDFNWGGDP
jgi:hypothetical protein